MTNAPNKYVPHEVVADRVPQNKGVTWSAILVSRQFVSNAKSKYIGFTKGLGFGWGVVVVVDAAANRHSTSLKAGTYLAASICLCHLCCP